MQTDKRKEQQLVLEVIQFLSPDILRLKDLLAQDLDYPYLLGHILHHRMGAVAYHVLKQTGLLGQVHREFRNTLRTVYESHRAQAESMQTALSMIAGMLADLPTPYAVLKGSYLTGLYPQGLRTSNDIDVLVNQEQVSVLTARLKKNGFIQGHIRDESLVPASRQEILASRMNRGETVPFIRPVGLEQMEYLEIDVNFSVDYKARQETDIVSRLIDRREPLVRTACGRLYTLCKTDFLIDLCLHLYKEATIFSWVQMKRDQSLYKYCDIYLLIHQWMKAAYAQSLAQQIRSYGVQRECYYALNGTRLSFQIHKRELDWLLDAICPEDTAFMNEVLDPMANRIYHYQHPFSEWIFCSERVQNLKERV